MFNVSCTKNILPLASAIVYDLLSYRNGSCLYKELIQWFRIIIKQLVIIIASRCRDSSHVPLVDLTKQRVTQHMFANTSERKNWCDVRYIQFSCRANYRTGQNVTRWDLLLFEQIRGNVTRKNVWPVLRFVFDRHQLTMWNPRWR